MYLFTVYAVHSVVDFSKMIDAVILWSSVLKQFSVYITVTCAVAYFL